jgi:hypothetical protein
LLLELSVNQPDRLENFRIASPCPANWEQMNGDARVRFCDLCSLHVYNISEMSRAELDQLITNTSGRLCARLYRRSDGTIITKDCPVGLRAFQRRLAKRAGAICATIISFAIGAFGQKATTEKSSCRPQVQITKANDNLQTNTRSIVGTVLDRKGAAIPKVKIELRRQNGGKVAELESDDKGAFVVRSLVADTYELSFSAKNFTPLKIVEIKMNDRDSVTVDAIMVPKGVEVEMGIVAAESLLDTPAGITIITGDMIRRLPIHE